MRLDFQLSHLEKIVWQLIDRVQGKTNKGLTSETLEAYLINKLYPINTSKNE